MDAERLHALARHFPLIGRARPACPPLPERVREITEIAGKAVRSDDPASTASRALNLAALIASDCGLKDTARQLCWRHIDGYRCDRPLTASEAAYMLEPAINLARLHLRDRNGHAAWQCLDAIDHALTTRTDALIEGRTLSLADISGSPRDRANLRRWMWMVLLSEGIRAYLIDGQWGQALKATENLKGVGSHLLEGRQIKIITCCLDGAPEDAATVLSESVVSQPWEATSAACLDVFCRITSGRPTDRAVRTMVDNYLTTTPEPGHAAFRVRWGSAVDDLAATIDDDQAQHVADQMAQETLDSGDGYAARNLLADARATARLGDTDLQSLSSLVRASGLDTGRVPDPLFSELNEAIKQAESLLPAYAPCGPAKSLHR